MKLYIATLLLVLVTFTSANRVTDAEDFLRGLVRGSLGSVGEDIVGCIKDGEQTLINLFHVAEDFEKAALHGNKAAFKEALGLIGDIVKILPHEVQECKSGASAVKSLEKIIVEFVNPTALVVDVGKKIIWHARSIYKDVKQTTTDLKAHDYEDAGYRIGDLIKILFLNSKLGTPFDDASSLLESFYMSAFKLDLDLSSCESLLDGSVEDVFAGIKEMVEHETYDSTIMGFIKFYLASRELYINAHSCTSAWDTLKEGGNQLAPFVQHPTDIIDAAQAAAKSNPITVAKDLATLKKGLDSDPTDYAKVGSSTGDLVRLVLKKM
ncbi:unnamed protein product [Moneuplotes crassus]|uniref:Uncharacterized protein n=1 Tax=Euplotes crassus TaxID=5936 RepID=A0AAD1XMI1_EUPCR|nr:unnamed protein product [Moneuplotes crassus]